MALVMCFCKEAAHYGLAKLQGTVRLYPPEQSLQLTRTKLD